MFRLVSTQSYHSLLRGQYVLLRYGHSRSEVRSRGKSTKSSWIITSTVRMSFFHSWSNHVHKEVRRLMVRLSKSTRKNAYRVQEIKLWDVVYQNNPFVMAVHSPMLRAMLTSKMPEVAAKSQSKEIRIVALNLTQRETSTKLAPEIRTIKTEMRQVRQHWRRRRTVYKSSMVCRAMETYIR